MRLPSFLSVWGLLLPLVGVAADLPRPVPGWRMELVASAPAVRHPSVVACAPDGRIFVAEDPMDISTPDAAVSAGRILCLHPDGRTTVFADGIYAAFGLQYLDGKLYVLHNPFLSAFDDVGDHAGRRVDLVRNTNPNWSALGWNDHVPANFRLGLDGRFYVATGDKGLFGAVGTDGKRFDFSGGGIFRLRPDGTELEPFSTGVRNILDVALDAEDELFTYDNTDEHEWMGRLTHMVDGGFYGYPHDFIPQRPYTLWMMADYGAGAATGVTVALDDALPAAWRGNLFLADFGKRQVTRVRTERDGGSFRAVEKEDLFVDPPEDFRPVGITWTPDGRSLLICDWQHRDSKDTNAVVGRLWKLTSTASDTGTPKPSWYRPAALGQSFTATTEELVTALSHPSRDVRHCAQLRLIDRGREPNPEARTVIAALTSLAADRRAEGQARIHSLWALDGIHGAKEVPSAWPEWVASLARDPDPLVARQALRLAGERRLTATLPGLLQQLGASDRSLRVRAATALGRLGDPRAVPALLAALDESDLFARYAAFHALNRIGRADSTAWPAIVAALADDRPRIAEGAALALRSTEDEALLAALAATASNSTLPVAAREVALRLAAGQHHQPSTWRGDWWAYHPFRTTPPTKTVVWAGTPAVFALLDRMVADPEPALRVAAVKGLAASGDTNQAPILRARFSAETDPGVRRELVRALGQWRDAGSALAVATLMADPATDPESLAVAVDAAVAIGGPEVIAVLPQVLERNPRPNPAVLKETLRALATLKVTAATPALVRFTADADEGVRTAAIAALGRMGGDEARVALLPLLRASSLDTRRAALNALADLPAQAAIPELLAAWQEPDLRSDAFLALTRSPDLRALNAYLDGLASKSPEQRAAARQALDAIQHEAMNLVAGRIAQFPPEVVRQLQDVFQDEPGAQAGPIFQIKPVMLTLDAYLEFALNHPGDAARGDRLFHDPTGLNCIGCHRVTATGGEVGPDLSNAGAQFSRRELAESILWPGKVVREGYQAVLIELKDGDEVTGLIKGETTDLLTLRDAAGQLRQIPQAQVASRQQGTQSLMPDGLQAALTLEEFADLVAYTAQLRQAK